jgi:hypothetical protein
MCEEYQRAYNNILNKFVMDESKRKFFEETPKIQKSYVDINTKYFTSHEKIQFYHDYDTVYESISSNNVKIVMDDRRSGTNNSTGTIYGIPSKFIKRKVNPRIYVTGLPDNCLS